MATLGMLVLGARGWSAGPMGRVEPHPTVCGSIYAGATGVLDTFIFTFSSLFLSTATAGDSDPAFRHVRVCVALDRGVRRTGGGGWMVGGASVVVVGSCRR